MCDLYPANVVVPRKCNFISHKSDFISHSRNFKFHYIFHFNYDFISHSVTLYPANVALIFVDETHNVSLYLKMPL